MALKCFHELPCARVPARSPGVAWRGLGLAVALSVLVLAGCGRPGAPELLASGLELQAKGDSKAAQIQFRAALEADPQLHAARMAFGSSLLAAGDAEAAAIELERVVTGAPSTPGVFEAYASAVVASSNEKRAVQLLSGLKPESPADKALVRAYLALVLASQGEGRRAEEALRSALEADANSPLALTFSARNAWSQGQRDDALRLVEQALKVAPTHPEALHFRGVLHRAEGNAKAAIELWQKALATTPGHVASSESIISARLEANEVAAARQQWEALRKHVPWHPTVRLAEARLFIAEGDLPKGRERVLSLLSAAPDHPGLLALAGFVESRIGSPVQAAAHYRKLIAANPEQDAVRVGLAQVELRLGQYADAARTLRPLLTNDKATPQVLAIASEVEQRQGNYKLADELLRRATEVAPDDSRLQAARLVRRMRLGEVDQPLVQLEQLATGSKESYADEALFSARMALGEYPAALQALDRLEAKNPGQARFAEMRARVHLDRRDFVQARAALDEALKRDPKGFGPVAALAMVDRLEDKPADAVARVQAVLDRDPEHVAALLLMAEMQSRDAAGAEKAATLLRKAVAASPTSAEARLKLIELTLSRRLFKEALDHSRAALAALPNDERLLDATGRAQLLSGDVEQAATTFRSLAGLLPKSAAPLLQLARVYDAQGRRDAVIATLQRAVDLEPLNENVQRTYVDLLIASRQGAQALAHVRRLRETRPKEPVSFMLLAMVQERSRDIPAAAASLRDGLAQTGSPELAGKLLALLMRHGKDAEAGAFSTQWLQQNPDDLSFEYLVAERDIVKGDLKKAEERLRRVIQRYPGNVLALNNLAWVAASQGAADAVAFARRAVSISPERPDLLDTLAFALSSSGKHQDALAVQRRAVELAPEAAIFRLGLAKVAQAAGDAGLARSEIAMVKKLDAGLGASKSVKELESKLK